MSLQAAASIDVSTTDPLAAVRAAAGGRNAGKLRRLAVPAVVVAVGLTAAAAAPRAAHVFAAALVRAIHADPRWVVAGLALECASFAGYIVLFRHVAGRAAPRIGLRASYELTLGGAAITRLLPTAGAGGAALTFWGLRRAGLDNAGATRTLLSFLTVLYSVFLGAILVAGALVGAGVGGAHVSPWLSTLPAAAAAVAIGAALMLAFRRRGRQERGSLGGGVRDACRLVARPQVPLLGAPAWWGFDMLVLWATFNAFGRPPAPLVLVLGYFLGQVANTLPLPGAASGGMVGAFIAFGMPPAVVIPAVLAYRALAIWTPVPAGAAALGSLRRTVGRWAVPAPDEPGHLPAEPPRTLGARRGGQATRTRAVQHSAPRPTVVDESQRGPPSADAGRARGREPAIAGRGAVDVGPVLMPMG